MRHAMLQALLLIHAKDVPVFEMQEQLKLNTCLNSCVGACVDTGWKKNSGMLAVAQHQSEPTVS